MKTLALLLALSSPAMLSAQAVCTGHFVNRSDYPWSITGFDGSQTTLIIAPGATIDIPYNNATAITVSGDVPDRPYTKTFQLQQTDACYTVLYDGNPGFVALNNPNPGDIVTCADGC